MDLGLRPKGKNVVRHLIQFINSFYLQTHFLCNYQLKQMYSWIATTLPVDSSTTRQYRNTPRTEFISK